MTELISSPSEWSTSTSITVQSVDDGVMVVSFKRSIEYKFPKYHVKLYDSNTHEYIKENCVRSPRSNISVLNTKFRNVCTGSYEINVMPYNSMPTIHENCLCKNKRGLCDTCTESWTSKFNFSSNICGHIQTTPGLVTTAIIVPSVISACIAVILLILLICNYRRRRLDARCGMVPCCCVIEGTILRDIDTDINPFYNVPSMNGNKSNYLKPSTLYHLDLNNQEIKIFMVYECENNTEQGNIVRQFCKFLSEISNNIKVEISDTKFQEINSYGNLTKWVMHMTSWADKVIVVNSKYSLQYFDNKDQFQRKSRTTVALKRPEIDSERDILILPTVTLNVFRTAVDIYQKLYNDDDNIKSKLVMVYFWNDDKSCIIPPFQHGVSFCLMDQVKEFLRHIKTDCTIGPMESTENLSKFIDGERCESNRSFLDLMKREKQDSGLVSFTSSELNYIPPVCDYNQPDKDGSGNADTHLYKLGAASSCHSDLIMERTPMTWQQSETASYESECDTELNEESDYYPSSDVL